MLHRLVACTLAGVCEDTLSFVRPLLPDFVVQFRLLWINCHDAVNISVIVWAD